jgi:hypothetical protein
MRRSRIGGRLEAVWQAEALYYLTTVHEVAVTILERYPDATHLVLEEDYGESPWHWAADRIVNLGGGLIGDDALSDLDSEFPRTQLASIDEFEEFEEFYAPLTDLPQEMPDDERFDGVLVYAESTERHPVPPLLVYLPAARDLEALGMLRGDPLMTTLSDGLTCSEADAIAEVLLTADQDDAAEHLLRVHGNADEDTEDDRHYHLAYDRGPGAAVATKAYLQRLRGPLEQGRGE